MVSPLLGRFLVSFNLQSAICGLQSAVCSQQSANVIHRFLKYQQFTRECHTAPKLSRPGSEFYQAERRGNQHHPCPHAVCHLAYLGAFQH